jgi:hypothetical protein
MWLAMRSFQCWKKRCIPTLVYSKANKIF